MRRVVPLLSLALAAVACSAGRPAPQAARPESVAAAERVYEAARFWKDQLDLTRDRGADRSEEGLTVVELGSRFDESRERLRSALSGAGAANASDAAALFAMREALAGALAPADERGAEAPTPDCSGDRVAQAGGGDEPAPLGALLYRCYGDAARAIVFEGETLDRLSVIERLRTEPDRERRRRLFLALAPLWRAVDGDGGAASPFRELVRRSALAWRRDGSPVDRQLVALGLDPRAFELSLVQVLEAWRALLPPEPIEPWDLHYSNAAANRALAATVPRDRLEAINRHYYADLGAEPACLGVRYDLEPRSGKTPVAFTNFGARARLLGGRSLPTVPWVFATYRVGGFDNLVELLHETGHAVHIAAIRTRPALLDWPDLDAFTEALGDLLALEAYEPAWQRRYLGAEVPLAESLRSKYGAIVLDIAWALLEIRLHREPERAANEVWTELATRYLGVAPHPEWSWWMLRGQLVDSPGYMASYAIGAVMVMDLRARAHALRGPFTGADAGTYAWLSERLYRFGRERPARRVLEDLLGRPVSADALRADLARAAR